MQLITLERKLRIESVKPPKNLQPERLEPTNCIVHDAR